MSLSQRIKRWYEENPTHPKIPHWKLQVWAQLLVNHSISVQKDEKVMIRGEIITLPLLWVLEDLVIRAGGLPDMDVFSPDCNRGYLWGASMAQSGTRHQAQQLPFWLGSRFHEMDAYIEVMGTQFPEFLRDWPHYKSQDIVATNRPLTETRLATDRWVLTLYPTAGDAANENMDLATYANFIVGASMADHSKMEKSMEPLAAAMKKAKAIRIVTRHLDGRKLVLTMDIPINPKICDGRRNFPDGEVFTSPDANSVSGEIFVDLPIVSKGVQIKGIWLKFVDGVIVDFSAEEGEEQLKTIIGTDDGSKRLGEIAFGMNNGLDRVLTHPLYVEKVAGTLHIAIGSSYKDLYTRDELKAAQADGSLNESAVHVDIVADGRPGGCVKQVFLIDDDGEHELMVGEDMLWVLAA